MPDFASAVILQTESAQCKPYRNSSGPKRKCRIRRALGRSAFDDACSTRGRITVNESISTRSSSQRLGSITSSTTKNPVSLNEFRSVMRRSRGLKIFRRQRLPGHCALPYGNVLRPLAHSARASVLIIEEEFGAPAERKLELTPRSTPQLDQCLQGVGLACDTRNGPRHRHSSWLVIKPQTRLEPANRGWDGQRLRRGPCSRG